MAQLLQGWLGISGYFLLSFDNPESLEMQDKRKSPRRAFERAVRADFGDGSPRKSCTLRDISASGARVGFAEPVQCPTEFVLHLSDYGHVARKCVVVWRSETGQEVGVEFVARLVPVTVGADHESVETTP